jgi:hypothetical protein
MGPTDAVHYHLDKASEWNMVLDASKGQPEGAGAPADPDTASCAQLFLRICGLCLNLRGHGHPD